MCAALGVTTAFLQRGLVFTGGIAADTHMRRPRTAKPAQWKRIEARINEIRMHASYLLARVDLTMSNHVVHVDPVETTPAAAAQLLRATWRMPIGEVPNLLRWVESAGVIVFSEDLGSPRINAMSQWAGEYAVMVVNSMLPTDQNAWQ